MTLAELDDDPVLRVEAHFVRAVSLQLAGAVLPSRAQFELAIDAYDRSRSATHISLYSQDPAVVCLIRLGLGLMLLGDPVGSAQRRAESLELAEQLGHPFSLAYALGWASIIQVCSGRPDLARTQGEATIGVGRTFRMPFWLAIGSMVHGWGVAAQGDVQQGIDEMRAGFSEFEATGIRFLRSFHLGLLAEQHGHLGNIERGLTIVAEAIAVADRTKVRWFDAELHRRKGDLLVLAARIGEAEAAYRSGIDVAHYQGARAFELRSANSLADLWARQGRARDAALLLEPIVAGFEPAIAFPDLDHARDVLADQPRTP
jgi:predicted ATPase